MDIASINRVFCSNLGIRFPFDNFLLYTQFTEVFGIYGTVILAENKALHCRQSKEPDRKPKTSVD